MKILDKLKGMAILYQLSAESGVPLKQIEAEIQECIDEAWKSADPKVQANQRLYFPDGKPTPMEFIVVMGRYISSKHHMQLN